MSPQEIKRTNHVDAFLSTVGIGALVFLASTMEGYNPTLVVTAISLLAVRSTALLINAAKIAAQVTKVGEK